MNKTIKDLKNGEFAIISGFSKDSDQSYRSKLISFGLIPGTLLEVIRRAPMGDPIEIKIRGYNLFIRKFEADCILIKNNLYSSCEDCNIC